MFSLLKKTDQASEGRLVCLGIRTKITGQASEDFWCDSRRGWVRRTRSTQAQTRRSSRAKKTVGLTSLFFPNALFRMPQSINYICCLRRASSYTFLEPISAASYSNA